ncbi:MAG: methionine--tRNA ligase [Candidatus Aenigmarchaeota archaeon]|nr:methionine--tRNA ligase [Candidatus Aenigmarchaeota archaeon]
MVVKLKDKFYITTACPYVNAPPHVGHALELMQTDVIARYRKLRGNDVFFLTGTDENAQKNVLSAEHNGIKVEYLVNRNAKLFKKLTKTLGISNDDFIRTTDKERHWKTAIKIWETCTRTKDIYKKTYTGLYCVGCEAFVTEKDLINGLCPEHLKPPEKISEENYFFKLSKYQKKLEELIEKNKLRIIPETRKNEVLSFIRDGLEDFSVSRPAERMKKWGIPVPEDDKQTVYVWFDALIYYLSGLDFYKNSEKYRKYWPADLQVIGKGIIRFHAVYWPAMLLSAGIDPPKSILAHGYITVNGQKISKSLGNVVDPIGISDKYGVDQLRYFLLRDVPVFDDGDFSEKALVERVDNELVANYSNLFYRITSFIEKNFNGKIPKPGKEGERENDLKKLFKDEVKKYEKAFEEYRLNEALTVAMDLSSHLNKYFQEKQPWVTVKSDPSTCATTLYTSVNLLKIISTLLYPFIPSSSEKALNCLGVKVGWENVDSDIKENSKIKSLMLFKKIEYLEKIKHKKIEIFIEPEVRNLGINIKAVIIRGVNIANKNPKLEELKKQVVQDIKKVDLNNPVTSEYRNLYQRMKVKGESPGEFFVNFVKEKGNLPNINTLVDSYNLISLKTLISAGAHDLDKIEGNVVFKIANGGELFVPLNSKTPQKINKGEQICMDDKKVLCWIDIKQGDQDRITKDTKEVLIYVQGNKNISEKNLNEAIEKISNNVIEFCGGSVERVDVKLLKSEEKASSTSMKNATKLIYLEDSCKLHDTAKVLDVVEGENNKIIILDQTIFYPQGGGQQYDTGKIESGSAIFVVKEVRLNQEGVVNHIGDFIKGNFNKDEEVKLIIDKERRMFNSKLQSTGHLVDNGMINIGMKLVPTKGYHFPDGPYVEYDGNIPEDKREEIRQKIEHEVNRMIKQGFNVKAELVNKDQLKEKCYFIPEFLPTNKPLRVVTVWGNLGIPCGGTHVKNIKEIGEVKISKISTKAGKVKISYLIEK